MEHLLLKAATTAATDEGTFTAVISTASVDRDKDIIEPSAMVASLAKWALLGKLVPLAYNHTDEVIGHIDPATATVKDGEVIANGWVDQSIERGEEVWRLVKSGTLSFSFGFLFEPKTGATKLPGGSYRVEELDIFEISAIPVGPANNDTRVLSFKSSDDLRREAELVARTHVEEGFPRVPGTPPSAVAKAFAEFDPSTMTPDGVAAALDGMNLGDGRLEVRLAVGEKQLTQVTRELLDNAGRERFGTATTYAYVDDFDPQAQTVVYCISSDNDGMRYERLSFTLADNTATLGDTATEVTRTTTYLPKGIKAVDETGKEPTRARSVDPLRKQAESVALEFASGGLSLRKPPRKVEPAPAELIPLRELKQRMRDEILTHLSGEITT